jgi:hypothetical protein
MCIVSQSLNYFFVYWKSLHYSRGIHINCTVRSVTLYCTNGDLYDYIVVHYTKIVRNTEWSFTNQTVLNIRLKKNFFKNFFCFFIRNAFKDIKKIPNPWQTNKSLTKMVESHIEINEDFTEEVRSVVKSVK